MRYAVLFPGQGSQFVGMGAELFEAHPDLLGDAADQALGWSLREACLSGPEGELTRTDRAQPTLYAVAYALWSEFAERAAVPPAAAAGHSLGEYTAHAAAGTFRYLDGLRLVAARGAAMAEAAAREPGGMAALLGADVDMAEEVCASRRASGGRLWVANVNAPGQVVVAGGTDDLAWLSENARAMGIRRAVVLKVAGAFHSPFMEPAVQKLRVALAEVEMAPPAFPVWANATATPVSADEVADSLAAQIIRPVRFSGTLAGMAAQGIEVLIHVGPGEVTAGMARRAAPGTDVMVVNDLDSVRAVVDRLESLHTMIRRTRRD